MEALVASMSVASLVFPTELVEPLKLTRRDVTEYDDGPALSLTLSQDPFQPTEPKLTRLKVKLKNLNWLAGSVRSWTCRLDLYQRLVFRLSRLILSVSFNS